MGIVFSELAERHKACEKERDKHKNASKTAFKAARDEWQDNEHLVSCSTLTTVYY